jgi:hypothetical protein
MNWLLALSALICVALVVGGVWWACSPDRVLKRQIAREARRAGHVEPSEFSAFWDGR